MQSLNTPVSACKYCQYYNPVGRRGGTCQMLGVSVQGTWKSCHLGTTPFTSNYKNYEYESCDLGHSERKKTQKLADLAINSSAIPDLMPS